MSEVLSVTTPVKTRDDKTRFRQIGAAYRAREGQNFAFKITLDATPLNGELLVFAPKDQDGRPALDASGLPEELRVTTPVKGVDDRVRFRPIGIAFAAKPGQNFMFKVLLDAAPVNGELVLFVPNESDGQ
ncbi:hypothetical protein M3484_16475 [Pseudomonas sp. GX19020]|uniref:hypothetical protein n=1 Tax=Pseudomonas sp. GX19020 TaxID=2942277 RepID=UPI00201924F2|nr:hypothetical protein [Pseudomonas sp. GX19020]MCL4068168.1 hypothetical protein [Pseudomonas sp. GX19020]